MNSMPYYICEQSFGACINNNQGNQEGEDNCTTNIRDQCGTLNITNFNAPATTSSTAPATSTVATVASGTSASTSASASATKNAAAAAMIVGKEYGSSIIAALFVAAFGFMV
jgi:hypothetical protein